MIFFTFGRIINPKKIPRIKIKVTVFIEPVRYETTTPPEIKDMIKRAMITINGIAPFSHENGFIIPPF